MADFDVKLKKLQELLAVEDECAAELGHVQEDISNVKNNLTFKLDISAVIQGQLGRVYTHVGTQKKNVRQLKSGLNGIIKQYNRAETNICNIGLSGKKMKTSAAWLRNAEVHTTKKTRNKWSQLKYLKKFGKAALDALGKAGTYGKMGSLPIAILKMIIDGDGITAKDIGAGLKGMGNSIIGLCENDIAKSIKELAGLEKYKGIRLDNAKASWAESLRYELSPVTKLETGGIKIKGSKIAGWTLALVGNGFANYEEYGGFTKRAAAETVTETLVDIGKMAALTAGIAAGFAAIGVSAPAVVVGGTAVAASAVADIVCEKITGKPVTEYVSDGILDLASQLGRSISGAADTAKRTVSGWLARITNTGSSSGYAVAT